MSVRLNRLFAVEDDNVAAFVLRMVATELGIGFVRAGSARLASLTFRPRGFVLAVVDLGLPEDTSPDSGDADGLDVLGRIRDADPELPTIVWSASANRERIDAANSLGARFVDKAEGRDGIRRACVEALDRSL